MTDDAAIKARFTAEIDRLCNMVEDYGEALQPYAKKLEKAYRKIEKRHVKGEFPPGTEIPEEIKVCPPPKGYVKMNYSDNPWVEDPVSVIYRPREPVNPLLWFNIRGNANIQRGPKEDEKLMCDYVLLAVIHDYMLRQSTDRPIFCEKYDGKWFKRDQFRQEVGQHYLPNEATLYCKGRTTQERAEYCQNLLSGLKRAFNQVKADIEASVPSKEGARQEKDGQGSGPIEKQGNTSKTEESKIERVADEVENLVAVYPIAANLFRERVKVFNEYCTEYLKAKKKKPDECQPSPLLWEIDDKLSCYYATLAVIHDAVKTKAPVYLSQGLDTQAAGFLYHNAAKHKTPYGDTGLDTALKYVRADIEKHQKEQQLTEASGEGKGGQGEPLSKKASRKVKTDDKMKARFTFNKAQAFFDKKDLGLPTGAEVNPVKILKKLVESFGKVVPYQRLDESSSDTASDFLRGKIRTINLTLRKQKVPASIKSKRWGGYVLSNSRTHS